MINKIEGQKFQRLDTNLEDKLREDQVVEQLGKASIWDIFKVLEDRGIARGEIEKYFSQQHKIFNNKIIQPVDYYAQPGMLPDYGSYCTLSGYRPPPSNAKAAKIDSTDGALIRNGLAQAFGKAATIGSPKAAEDDPPDDDPPIDPENPEDKDIVNPGDEETKNRVDAEIEGLVDQTMYEYEALMRDISTDILDQQMLGDVELKTKEIEDEIKRLVSLARSGKIGIEFILVALAKYNMTKNGVKMAWLGKKAYWINDQMSQITEQIYGSGSPMAFSDMSRMETAKSDIKELQFGLTGITNSIQMITQDMEKNSSAIQI